MVEHDNFAVLVKSKKRRDKKSLGLIVISDPLSSIYIDEKDYEMLGQIKFKTSSMLDEIIKDFSETYIGGIKWNNPLGGFRALGLRYPSSYEATIPGAFTDYFPHLKS